MMTREIVDVVLNKNEELKALQRKGKTNWTMFFNDEEEIVQTLKELPVVKEESMYRGSIPAYTGYKYIHSFIKYIKKNGHLTEKQMTMAKKIAPQIKIAYAIKDMWKEEDIVE